MVPGAQIAAQNGLGNRVLEQALDENNEVIGYEFVNFGKMMDFIKSGMSADDAFKKAQGHYGRFTEADGAVKYIDPRKQ